MATTYFANHFTDDVVQVEASLGVWYQHFVFFLDGLPVYAMHVFQVETIAVGTPYFIVNLCPFFGIIYMSHHILQADGILHISLSSREVAHEHLSTLREECLLAAWSKAERCTFGHGFFFLSLEIECLCIASAIII